jgi:hypothetical protein
MDSFCRISRLPPYALGIIRDLTIEVRSRGEDIIDLGMGNPDLATPKHIVAKLVEAAKNPKNHRYSVGAKRLIWALNCRQIMESSQSILSNHNQLLHLYYIRSTKKITATIWLFVIYFNGLGFPDGNYSMFIPIRLKPFKWSQWMTRLSSYSCRKEQFSVTIIR